MLRAAGATEYDGEPVDQDLVAVHAGTLLPVDSDGSQVPPGAESRQDYRFELARADPAACGTSPQGLARAVEELSGGQLVAFPMRSSWWFSQVVERLLDCIPELDARLIANVRTGALWGARPAAEPLVSELDGLPAAPPPAADWDAGHFVELVALMRGRAGALVLVRDSYPSLGWMGHHLQPPRALANALNRGDGREGGVLAVLARERIEDAEQVASALALEAQMWDNGTGR